MKKFRMILSYITMLFILLMYTFFLDGTSGMILMVFFILTPIISVALTIIAGKGLKATLICTNDNIRKKHSLNYTVKLIKKSPLPAPFIIVHTSESPHFSNNGENIIKASMAVKKEISIEKEICPQFSGNGYISIDSVVIYDYLNIFSFKIKNMSYAQNISITPEIHELNSAGTVFRAVSDNSVSDNDDNENSETITYGISSYAGYEHREYIKGDPLKRINWKLSARKQKLMVRLDENMPSVRPSIVLNLSECKEDTAENIRLKELITEGCLSFMDFCIRQGKECDFRYYVNGMWNKKHISSYSDLSETAFEIPSLPDYASPSIPDSTSDKSKTSGTFIIFTQKYTEKLDGEISAVRRNSCNVMTIISEKTSPADNLWFINELFEIKEFNRGGLQ